MRNFADFKEKFFLVGGILISIIFAVFCPLFVMQSGTISSLFTAILQCIAGMLLFSLFITWAYNKEMEINTKTIGLIFALFIGLLLFALMIYTSNGGMTPKKILIMFMFGVLGGCFRMKFLGN